MAYPLAAASPTVMIDLTCHSLSTGVM